jgi:hypothetical protein
MGCSYAASRATSWCGLRPQRPGRYRTVRLRAVSVKAFDTEEAARIRPLLADCTAVVLLQSGVDNEEKLASVTVYRATIRRTAGEQGFGPDAA